MKTTLTRCGNITEITTITHENKQARILRVDADHYINLGEGTGELHEVEHHNTRADDYQSLRRTFRRIRQIVNTNCTKTRNLRWITLTYAENMTDAKRLKTDFDSFIKRYRRKWGDCEYISVAEPQRRGAWHLHVITIYPGRAPFVKNDALRDCWGHGFVNVKKIDDVDNIGAYLSAYLSDVEFQQGEDVGTPVVKEVQGTPKKIIKGGRMKLYPANMNIYRCSRGIKQPLETVYTDESEAIAQCEGQALTYEAEITFETAEGFRQHVKKRYYNSLRDPKDFSHVVAGCEMDAPTQKKIDTGAGVIYRKTRCYGSPNKRIIPNKSGSDSDNICTL